MDNFKLDEIIALADKTEFYQSIISADQFNFYVETPLLTKKDLCQNIDKMLIPKYNGAQKSLLKKSRTSGSTGEFVEVYWKKEDLLRSNLCLWRERNRCYGIKTTDRFVSFHSLIYSDSGLIEPRDIAALNSKTNFSISKFDFNSGTIKMYCDKIRKFDPIWMFLQPSCALHFIEQLKKKNIAPKNIAPNLKYIELTGEVLLNSEKELISGFFNVPVCNMYGCNEVNTIAYECQYGHMHILDDNVFVQIHKCSSSRNHYGNLVVTSLHNTAMPIVSYLLGDNVLIEKNEKCPCGKSTGYKISSIIGRNSELLQVGDKNKVSVYEFTYCIEYVNSILRNPIQQFKITSDNNSGCTIVLKIDFAFEKWKETIQEEICKKINEYVGIDVHNIRFTYMDSFDTNTKGKRKVLIGEN